MFKRLLFSIASRLLILVLLTSATALSSMAQPGNQNFEALTNGNIPSVANSYSLNGIKYSVVAPTSTTFQTVNGTPAAFLSVQQPGYVGGGFFSKPSRMLILNQNVEGLNGGTYQSDGWGGGFAIGASDLRFETEDGAEFKINSMYVDAGFSNYDADYNYQTTTITGYRDGNLVATASLLSFETSNTPGTGANAASYTILMPGAGGGTLTFTGANWSNIDEIRFTSVIPVCIGLDDLNFSAPTSPGVLLSSNPTLSFSNNSGFSDNIATDGEGGSTAISDFDLQIIPVNSTGTTLTNSSLSYHDNSDWPGYPAIITYGDTEMHYGWLIRSANGAEFNFKGIDVHEWGDWGGYTFIAEAFKDGSSLGTIEFTGNTGSEYISLRENSQLSSIFKNVDEIRLYRKGGIDSWLTLNNVQIGPADTTPPAVITVSVNSLDPFVTTAGTASAVQHFTVSASNLTHDVAIIAPAGFGVGLEEAGYYGPALAFSSSSGSVTNKDIYIRLQSNATGTPSGNIEVFSTGATSQSVAVSGTVNTPTPPVASAVTITGTLTVGETLTGTYTYTDAESDTQSGSTFKWYRADNASGLNKTAIASAVAATYTLAAADAGKYISFEVTPKDGTDFGTAVESAAVLVTGLPVFTSAPVTTATENIPYSYAVNANDPDNDALTISAGVLPDWLTLLPNGEGNATPFGDAIPNASGIAGDADGNTYVTGVNATSIYKITPSGATTTWSARQSGNVYAMNINNGFLYISYMNLNKITRIDLNNPAAGETDVITGVTSPLSTAFKDGFIYVASYSGNKVIRVTTASLPAAYNNTMDVFTVSGPFGLAFNPNGDLYVAELSTARISKWNGSTVSPVITDLGLVSDVKVDAQGYLYASMFSGTGVYKYSPDLSVRTQVYTPTGTVQIWGMNLSPGGTLLFGLANQNQVMKLATGAVLSGTPGHTDVGEHPVTVKVSDGTNEVTQAFTITVSDPNPPLATTFSPLNAAVDIAVNTDLVLTFAETVKKGTGNITLKKASDDSVIEQIAVSSTAVSVSDTEVSINPAADLPGGTEIYIEIDATAFLDASDNAYAGISTGNWKFTTLLGAPAFTTTAITTATENIPYSYAASASDPNNDALTFSADGLPGWLALANPDVNALAFGDAIPGSSGIAADAAGNTYVAAVENNNIYKITPNGTTTLWAHREAGEQYAMAVDNGFLYLAYLGFGKITRIDLNNPDAGETNVLTGVGGPMSIAFKDGFMYIAGYGSGKVMKVSTASLPAAYNSSMDIFTVPTRIWGLGLNAGGDIYVAQYDNNSVSKWDGSAVSTVISGLPVAVSDVEFDAKGNLYVSTFGSGVYKYSPDLAEHTQIYDSGTIYSMNMSPAGTLLFGVYDQNKVMKLATGAVLSGTPGHADVGEHPVTLKVTDGTNEALQSFTITVSDPNPPLVTAFSPLHDAVDIAVNTDLVLTFSETVKKGTGNISLRKTSDNSLIEQIAVTDAAVSISGTEVTINPAADLPEGIDIYAEIDATAFLDASDNAYAGITAGNWKFTTDPGITPTDGILYVNKNVAGGRKTGASWTDALPELADALKFAKTANAATAATVTEIWVAKGTYKPLYRVDNLSGASATDRHNTFSLVDKVKIYGGFAGDETSPEDRDLKNTANKSILSGDIDNNDGLDGTINGNNAYHVAFSLYMDNSAVLDGFTITGGQANEDFDVWVDGNVTHTLWGGGMFNIYSSPVLRNLTIENNKAESGGGMLNFASHPLIEWTVINRNEVIASGAGIYNERSNPKLFNTLIINNTTTNPTISRGGAIYNYDSAPELVNVTIAKNTSPNGALYNEQSNIPLLKNSIIWDNNTGIYNDVNSTNTVTYSVIQGGYPGTGNLNADPLFTDAGQNDFTLQPGSVALNTGSNAAFTGLTANTLDLAGNTRVYNYADGGIIDMGAYERQTQLYTLTFANLVNDEIAVTYGDADFVAATSDPDAAVTFTLPDDNGVASIVGGKVHLLKAGEVMLTASVAASGAYDATSVSKLLKVGKKALTASVAPVTKVYDKTDAATLSFNAFDAAAGLVGSDDVAASYTSAVYADAKVGAGKTITITGLALTGDDADSYSLNSFSTTGEITVRTLTVTAAAADKIYDGLTTATATLSDNRVADDELTAAYTSATFDTKNIGTDKTISVSGISISGDDADNYSLAAASTTALADITQRSLVVTAVAANKEYDGLTTATATLADDRVADDELTAAYTSATFDTKNIGTGKTVTVSGISISGDDAANYTLAATSATALADITLRTLTITATAADKVYDGSVAATATLADNRIADDQLTAVYTAAAFDSKNIGTDKTVSVSGISISGDDAHNYSLAAISATTLADITLRTLTVSAAAADKEYDGLTAATATLSDNRVADDELTAVYATATFDNKNIGTDKTVSVSGISISGDDAANYALAATSATALADITQRTLTVTAAADDKEYDGSASATATLSDNRVADDVLTAAYTAATFDNKKVGADKTVSVSGISISGDDAANYTLAATSATALADITQRSLTVTAAADDKEYDGSATATATLADNRVADDVLTAAYTAATFDTKEVGTDKTVSISGISISGDDAANYTVNNTATALADITAKSITLALNAAPLITKVYDGNTTATLVPGNYTLTGVETGDEVLVSGTATYNNRFKGTNKTITATGFVLAGAQAANYSLSTTTATTTGSISAKPLMLVLNNNPAISKVYDGTTAINLSTNNYSLSGLVTGDQVDIAFTGNYATKDAGTAKPINVTSATLSGSNADNYTVNLSQAGASGNITPKTVAVAADDKTKAFGAADPQLTYSASGLLDGDALSGSLARDAGETAGTYAITSGSLSAGNNYTIAFTPSVLTIGSQVTTLTITAVAAGKIYGDSDPALTYNVSDLPAGLSLTGSLGRVAGENAGAYTITQGSLSVGAGYAINFISASLTINKAVLQVSAANTGMCVGTALPAFTLSYAGFKNGDTETSLTTQPMVSTTATASSPAGVYTLSPAGGLAANYELVYVNGQLTITAMPVAAISSNLGTTLSFGQTAILTASGGTSYVWADASGIVSGQNTATLTVKPLVTTTYTVTASNGTGCSSTASITITVNNQGEQEPGTVVVEATNIMSPNGDGKNDFWMIKDIELYPNNSVQVFDRGGRTVYSKKGYKNDWDATLRGLPLNEGTYYYIIDLGDGKTIKKGFITIVKP